MVENGEFLNLCRVFELFLDDAFRGGKRSFLENGKPVVKQGRKAMGPPLAKVDRQAAERKSP